MAKKQQLTSEDWDAIAFMAPRAINQIKAHIRGFQNCPSIDDDKRKLKIENHERLLASVYKLEALATINTVENVPLPFNKSEIPEAFISWADRFIEKQDGTDFSKAEALDDFKKNSTYESITSTAFMKLLRQFCQENNYNLKERIQKRVKILDSFKTVEFLQITLETPCFPKDRMDKYPVN